MGWLSDSFNTSDWNSPRDWLKRGNEAIYGQEMPRETRERYEAWLANKEAERQAEYNKWTSLNYTPNTEFDKAAPDWAAMLGSPEQRDVRGEESSYLTQLSGLYNPAEQMVERARFTGRDTGDWSEQAMQQYALGRAPGLKEENYADLTNLQSQLMNSYLSWIAKSQQPNDTDLAAQLGVSLDELSEISHMRPVAWNTQIAASAPTIEQLLSGWGSRYVESEAEINRQLAELAKSTPQGADTQYPVDDELSSLLGAYAELYRDAFRPSAVAVDQNITQPMGASPSPYFTPQQRMGGYGNWGLYGSYSGGSYDGGDDDYIGVEYEIPY